MLYVDDLAGFLVLSNVSCARLISVKSQSSCFLKDTWVKAVKVMGNGARVIYLFFIKSSQKYGDYCNVRIFIRPRAVEWFFNPSRHGFAPLSSLVIVVHHFRKRRILFGAALPRSNPNGSGTGSSFAVRFASRIFAFAIETRLGIWRDVGWLHTFRAALLPWSTHQYSTVHNSLTNLHRAVIRADLRVHISILSCSCEVKTSFQQLKYQQFRNFTLFAGKSFANLLRETVFKIYMLMLCIYFNFWREKIIATQYTVRFSKSFSSILITFRSLTFK